MKLHNRTMMAIQASCLVKCAMAKTKVAMTTLCLLAGAGRGMSQDQMLHVDMDAVIQTNFLGVNAVYHGFAFMPEQVDKGMNDADRKREFDRVAAMKLNIARTWYRPDWVCGDKLTNAFDWESVKMKAFYSWLQAMKERNVDVALQAGWWFPRDTYYGLAGPNRTDDPPRYARWVSESIHQLVTVRGFTNVKYLILFTEPTTTSSGNLPPGVPMWDYYVEVVQAIHKQLVADGRRKLVRLVGPNNTRGGVHLREAARDLAAELDILSGHDFNRHGYDEWLTMCKEMRNIATSVGKDLWLDEYGRQNEAFRQTGEYGNYLAQAVAASINAGLRTSTLWMLFDQQYVSTDTSHVNEWDGRHDSFYKGVHRWGICKWPRDTIANPTWPYPHWYAFSLISRYLGGRRGTRTYATTGTGQVAISAVRHPDDHWSFLVVNLTPTEKPIQVRTSRRLDRTLYRYLYNPAEAFPEEAAKIVGYSRVFENVGALWEDRLPRLAVAVYSTIPGAEAPKFGVLPGIREVSASSSVARPQFAFDGDRSTSWNSGGSAPAWIEAVFDEKRNLTGFSAIANQHPEGPTRHEVIATFADGTRSTVHVFDGSTRSGDVLNVRFDPLLRDVVAIRLATGASPSWVSWRLISFE